MRIIHSLSRQNTVSCHLAGENNIKTKYYKERNPWESMIILSSVCCICFIGLTSAAIDKNNYIIRGSQTAKLLSKNA